LFESDRLEADNKHIRSTSLKHVDSNGSWRHRKKATMNEA